MIVDKKIVSLRKRLVARICGSAFAFTKNTSEKDPLNYYIAHCQKHGCYMDHARGYYGKLTCPECLKERTERILHEENEGSNL